MQGRKPQTQKTMKTDQISILVALFGATIFMACSTPRMPADYSHVIHPPLEGVDVDFLQVEVNAAEGGTLVLPSGTRLHVPANAFTDAYGDPVDGTVQLKYREFHTAADILASGIPMKYTTPEGSFDFESAGMFELSGSIAGSPVFVGEGKKLRFELASYKSGDDFGFYRLDPTSGNWNDLGMAPAKLNQQKFEQLDSLRPLLQEPKIPEEDPEFFKLVVDHSIYKELAAFDNSLWKYEGKEAGNPNNNPWVFSERWRNINVKEARKKKGVYELTFISKRKRFVCKARPFSDQENEDAIAGMEKRMAQYKNGLQAREAEAQRLQLEADLLRNFEIASFGVYNCDRSMPLMAEGALKLVDGNMKLANIPEDVAPKLYHISSNNKLRARTGWFWKQFDIDPREENKLIAIAPGNKVLVFTNDRFREVPVSGGFNFYLKEHPQKVNNFKELEALIASI